LTLPTLLGIGKCAPFARFVVVLPVGEFGFLLPGQVVFHAEMFHRSSAAAHLGDVLVYKKQKLRILNANFFIIDPGI
jgi:hypothetical protein